MVGRGEEAIRAVNEDRTFWGQGVRDGGSQPDGMTGKFLPGRMPCCREKNRIIPMVNTRATLALLTTAHFEHPFL